MATHKNMSVTERCKYLNTARWANELAFWREPKSTFTYNVEEYEKRLQGWINREKQLTRLK